MNIDFLYRRINRLEHEIEMLKSDVQFWKDRYYHLIEVAVLDDNQSVIDQVNKENYELIL